MRASIQNQYTGDRNKPQSCRYLSSPRALSLLILGLAATGSAQASQTSPQSPQGGDAAALTHLYAIDAWDDMMLTLLQTIIRLVNYTPPPAVAQSTSVAVWAGYLAKEYASLGVPDNLSTATQEQARASIRDAMNALRVIPDLRLDPLQTASLRMVLKAMYVELGGDPADLGG